MNSSNTYDKNVTKQVLREAIGAQRTIISDIHTHILFTY